jgi:sugar-phosphatase
VNETVPPLNAKGLLVDMDGTLLDSTAAIEAGWRSFAVRWGLDPEEVLGAIHGRRTTDVIALYASRLPISHEQAVAYHRQNSGIGLSDVVAFPGALDLLESTPSERLVVVSSGTRAEILLRLEAAGLPPVPLIVGADDVDEGKPAPDPYLMGAKLLGLDPGQCLALEDAPAGIASASAAGCTTVGLLSTHTAVEMAGATLIARDLSAISVSSTRETLVIAVSTSCGPRSAANARPRPQRDQLSSAPVSSQETRTLSPNACGS